MSAHYHHHLGQRLYCPECGHGPCGTLYLSGFPGLSGASVSVPLKPLYRWKREFCEKVAGSEAVENRLLGRHCPLLRSRIAAGQPPVYHCRKGRLPHCHVYRAGACTGCFFRTKAAADRMDQRGNRCCGTIPAQRCRFKEHPNHGFDAAELCLFLRGADHHRGPSGSWL